VEISKHSLYLRELNNVVNFVEFDPLSLNKFLLSLLCSFRVEVVASMASNKLKKS
jgi:hypothetical protein